jgi:hypothetical protein
MPINGFQLIQMIKGGNNPQQLVMSVLQQRAQENPMYANLLQLAQGGDQKGLEQIARNLAKERGMDFDKEFANFKQIFK